LVASSALRVPIEPDAPGWLMITIVCPSDFSISPATSLVI
jgi:hypothetical protein